MFNQTSARDRRRSSHQTLSTHHPHLDIAATRELDDTILLNALAANLFAETTSIIGKTHKDVVKGGKAFARTFRCTTKLHYDDKTFDLVWAETHALVSRAPATLAIYETTSGKPRPLRVEKDHLQLFYEYVLQREKGINV